MKASELIELLNNVEDKEKEIIVSGLMGEDEIGMDVFEEIRPLFVYESNNYIELVDEPSHLLIDENKENIDTKLIKGDN